MRILSKKSIFSFGFIFSVNIQHRRYKTETRDLISKFSNISLTHKWDLNKYYHTGSEWTLEVQNWTWSLDVFQFHIGIHFLLGRGWVFHRRGVLDFTLKCIWCWGSYPGALGNMEYSFFIPWFTLTRSDCNCKGPNYGSNRLFKDIRIL